MDSLIQAPSISQTLWRLSSRAVPSALKQSRKKNQPQARRQQDALASRSMPDSLEQLNTDLQEETNILLESLTPVVLKVQKRSSRAHRTHSRRNIEGPGKPRKVRSQSLSAHARTRQSLDDSSISTLARHSLGPNSLSLATSKAQSLDGCIAADAFNTRSLDGSVATVAASYASMPVGSKRAGKFRSLGSRTALSHGSLAKSIDQLMERASVSQDLDKGEPGTEEDNDDWELDLHSENEKSSPEVAVGSGKAKGAFVFQNPHVEAFQKHMREDPHNIMVDELLSWNVESSLNLT